MRATLTLAALWLALQTLLPGAALAQDKSRPEDRTLRLGDTIVFTVPAPHKLQLTGAVGGVQLPTAAQINALFTLTPPLPASGTYNPGQTVTAKVNTTAAPGTNWQFTCGQHPPAMLSEPFTVAAASGPVRTFKIKAAAGMKWLLEKSEVQVDTTP